MTNRTGKGNAARLRTSHKIRGAIKEFPSDVYGTREKEGEIGGEEIGGRRGQIRNNGGAAKKA